MSLGKKIVIAAMILIAVVVGVIVYTGNKNTNDMNEKLAQAAGYYGMMDYDKTIAIYNSVLSTDKTCAEAYIGLASAYSAKGNDTKAIEILEQGMEATKNDSRIANKITEMSDVMIMSDTTEVSTGIATEMPAETEVTEVITTAPVSETTIPETVTTEETSVTTEEVTEITTTTEATTTTLATTTVTTTPAATTIRTTAATTRVTTAKPTIAVPNFIGIPKDEAAKLAKSKNIKLVFEYENNDTYPNGVVYYQSNREGTLVASSTTVYAYVCVNNTEYVSEDTKDLRNLGDAVSKWLKDNSSGTVTVDEKSNVVTIKATSTKRFVLDDAVVNAMRNCDDAILRIVTSDFTMSVSTSSVKNVSKLDLSSDYNGNQSRATFTIESGADSCNIRVVLTDCKINTSDYDDMGLYVNNKKPISVDLTIDEDPVFNVKTSGTYTIK